MQTGEFARVHGLADIGRKRDANEDRFLIAKLDQSTDIRQTGVEPETGAGLFSGTRGPVLLAAGGIGGHPMDVSV